MLGKHVGRHGLGMAITYCVITSLKLVARPANLDFVRTTDMAKGLFNFACLHDLLGRFIIFKNGWYNFLALQDMFEEIQHWKH